MIGLLLILTASAHECAENDVACNYKAAQEHLEAARAVNQGVHAFESKHLLNPVAVEASFTVIDWSAECPTLRRDVAGFTINTKLTQGSVGTWQVDLRESVITWNGMPNSEELIGQTSKCVRSTLWENTFQHHPPGTEERPDHEITYSFTVPTESIADTE